jgi:hypothetical protein
MPLRALVLASVILCSPSIAAAVTVEEIVALSKAGLPDEVLTALIDADRTMFGLSADQIISLSEAGVSKVVLLKMLASRREFEPRTPETTGTADTQAAQNVSTSNLLIVGTYPQQPEPSVEIVPYYVPYTPYTYTPFVSIGPGGHRRSRLVTRVGPSLEGFGRFMNDGSRRFINNGLPEPHVTLGPSPPAPRRRR